MRTLSFQSVSSRRLCWPSVRGRLCWTCPSWKGIYWGMKGDINGRVIAVAGLSEVAHRVAKPLGHHCGPAGSAVDAGRPSCAADQAHQAHDDRLRGDAEGQDKF